MYRKSLFYFLFISLLACNGPEFLDKEGFVIYGENKIHYQLSGKVGANTLVFIHGGGVDLQMWDKQVAFFEKDFQVLRYDIRGHGKSTFKDNTKTEVDDLIQLCAELDIEKFSLIGLSLGGIIATDVVLAYPEKVEKLILLSPGLSGVQEEDSSYLKPLMALGTAVQAGDKAAAAEIVLDMTFRGRREERIKSFLQEQAYVKQSFLSYIESPSATRPIQLIDSTPRQSLKNIGSPTLIIEGQKDLPYMARNARVLSSSIPAARLIRLPNAGHMVNVEAEEKVNQAILKFLTQAHEPASHRH